MTTLSLNTSTVKRRLFSVALIIVLLSFAWLGILDHYTYDYLKGSLLNALASYGVSRSLNAVISMFSTSTISIGVASLSIGELLDPLNDLVERFSELLTFAIGSLAIQKILLTIVSSELFNIILSLFGIGLIIALLHPKQPGLVIFSKLFLFTIFLRLCLAVTLLLNLSIDHIFIEPNIQANQLKVEHLAKDLDSLNQMPQTPQTMQQALLQLQQESTELTKNLQNRQDQVTSVQNQITEQNQRIDQIRQGLPFQERLNIFKEDTPELAKAKERLQTLQSLLSHQQKALNELQKKLDERTERMAYYKNRLTGQSESILDSVNQHFSSFINSVGDVDIFKIQAQLEASVENLLNLMMLYLLKTLLLPLFFMYLLIKGFQQIWQINLSDWLKSAAPKTKKAA